MAKAKLPCPTVLRLLLRYEPETGKLFWRRRTRAWFRSDGDAARWNTRFADAEGFTAKSGGRYYTGTFLGRDVLAHRAAWAIVHGEWPEVIDHLDGDKTNNRISNLRSVSLLENNRNLPKKRDNTSGHTGVRWCRFAEKWVMQIRCGNRDRVSRTFETKAEAIEEYARWKADLGYTERHGE